MHLPHCPKCDSTYTYEDSGMYICPECAHEWHPAEATEESDILIVKDANGNTVTLTGDATINEAGEMVFEGKDSAGNVVKVTGTAEKTGDGSFKVKEAAVAGTAKVTVSVVKAFSGYQLQYATKSNFSDAKTLGVSNGTTQTVVRNVSGLKKGTTYYVRIRGYKKSGNTISYGAWSTAKTIKIRR